MDSFTYDVSTDTQKKLYVRPCFNLQKFSYITNFLPHYVHFYLTYCFHDQLYLFVAYTSWCTIRQQVGAWNICLPISCQWTLLIPPENIRKPEVFWCFQGVSKEISGMKWVKNISKQNYEKWRNCLFKIILGKGHSASIKRHPCSTKGHLNQPEG